ncbi:hypothetical protein H6G76_16660 [Nostoc sp. FACHB-152]|uniref:hypothetical protein n=1 Tax=unclassified Nostoc TaxID=2593658 RepID=UPI0016831940|nr:MULTISPECIES: hypothetical protein [unclassified Nostoc]MBD2448754.1 hypothetical protein [Nostoc sp. FACHB-152]MBD2467533.1 hypothetical protein [Nostoc sp. FACHB-145]
MNEPITLIKDLLPDAIRRAERLAEQLRACSTGGLRGRGAEAVNNYCLLPVVYCLFNSPPTKNPPKRGFHTTKL